MFGFSPRPSNQVFSCAGQCSVYSKTEGFSGVLLFIGNQESPINTGKGYSCSCHPGHLPGKQNTSRDVGHTFNPSTGQAETSRSRVSSEVAVRGYQNTFYGRCHRLLLWLVMPCHFSCGHVRDQRNGHKSLLLPPQRVVKRARAQTGTLWTTLPQIWRAFHPSFRYEGWVR